MDANFLIRPARMDDVDGLVAVTLEAGPGMTTVPQSADAVAARIGASEAAFAGTGKARAKDVFYLVLEDADGIAGMSCIFPELGADRPFYSYRLSHIAAHAPEIDMRASTDILFLVNDFHGYTEIGTLLAANRVRGFGAGRMLSLSRFLLMAARRDRFGDQVMAEIRGWFDHDGRSPFWDHIAAKFFHTTFNEADRLSAHDFRFISHLMPKFPIYVSLLPEEARAMIGRPHESSAKALKLLQTEGFGWTRCIDIFDGGPSIECPTDRIRTVRRTRQRRAQMSLAPASADIRFMVTTPPGQPFSVILGRGRHDGDDVYLDAGLAARAGIAEGDDVLASPLKG